MTIAHRPSPQKVVRDYLLNTAYHDNKIKESVCLVNSEQLIDVLRQHFTEENRLVDPILQMMRGYDNGIPMYLVDHMRGEVLEDSLGRGSLQR